MGREKVGIEGISLQIVGCIAVTRYCFIQESTPLCDFRKSEALYKSLAHAGKTR